MSTDVTFIVMIFLMNANVKSLCSTPKTNIILYVDYISIF